MKILVLGGYGIQGSVICTDLTKSPEVSEVICTGRKLEKLKRVEEWIDSEKLSTQHVDVTNSAELRKALKDVDVVVNSTVPRYNLKILDEAFQAGVNYVDLASGPPYDNVPKELELSDKWKDAGLTALMNTGITPGVSNVFIKNATDKFDQVDEIKIRLYAKFEVKGPMSSWSPETMWLDMAEEPTVFENGEYKKVPPFSGKEDYLFPNPYGSQTLVWHAHEECHTLPRFIGKGLRFLDFKFPYEPLAHEVVRWGLVSNKPIKVKGIDVVPRSLLLALTVHTFLMDEVTSKIDACEVIESAGCILANIKGEIKGEKTLCTSYVPFPSLREAHERMPGSTNFSYATGVPAAVFAEMIGNRRIKTKGVFPTECLNEGERKEYLTKLAEEKGIMAHERMERGL